jgi:cytochrome c oxidase subunit 2
MKLKKQWHHVWRLLLLMVMVTALTGCGAEYLSALDPKGPVAQEQLDLMILSGYIMLVVFLIVGALYVFVLIRFRKRKEDNTVPVQVEGNHKLEILWTVIPIFLLVILAVPTVTHTFELAEVHGPEEAVQVKVIAHQFWWQFEYLDENGKAEVITAQELYIPTNKKVQVYLESSAVRHSFWVPSLAGKTDNNPGITNTMFFEASEEGTYSGKCAEICGTAHSLMNFKVVAVSPEQYESWYTGMVAASQDKVVPTDATLAQGQKVFQAQCITCHAIGGQGAAIAPNMTGFAERKWIGGVVENTPDLLAQWIRDPQTIKPGNLMPAFGEDKISDQDLDALVQYLSSLKMNE